MQILSEEKRGDAAIDLSEKFYARMLALGRYDAANFNGLARNYFRRNEPEKALEILRLMVVASIENKRETALAAVAALDAMSARAADAAKVAAAENNLNGSFDTLKIAAEIASEFQQTKAAIGFRRQLLEADPSDAANKIKLAAIYAGAGETVASENLLTQISNDANSPCAARWQARQLLKAEMPNAEYDAFLQFYNGAVAGKANENEAATELFINSLIADQNAELPARQELIKFYALSNKPFAALKLAETDKSAKSDELLAMLSAAAEKVGEYGKAAEFENAKSTADAERSAVLRRLENEKNKKATDFRIDAENTRNL